ncbi:MAG: lytic murein transglycosylase [Thermodesulfobacteriota bacterium]
MKLPCRHLARAILLLTLLLAPCLAWAGAGSGEGPKAADLVRDGQAIDIGSPRYRELFQELKNKHGFSQEELSQLFAGVTIKRRVLELMDTQWEAKPYHVYYPRFITPQIISQGKRLLAEHAELLDRVERESGVEREIVVAIWGVETQFGGNCGSFNMFQTLNTMFDAYPRRRDFYRDQLVEFLLLCRENGVPPLSVNGSYGGAFGQTQMIPTTFRRYAVDFDGDGRKDVWGTVPDVLASIANYLRGHGWAFGKPVYRELGTELRSERLAQVYAQGRKGLMEWEEVARLQGIDLPAPQQGKPLTVVGLELPDGGMRYIAGYPNFQAITKWNNSNRYAMVVAELAERIKLPASPEEHQATSME